ncbi:MAG: MoaD/ThiS family protein [Desulfobacula sp.]|nr:MoaD/ThiS family protein [Desulfobacula sp.]
MITINVRTSMALSEILGNWKFQVSLPQTSTFGDLLNQLTQTHGDELKPYLFETDGKTLASHIMFMVNGRNIRFLNKEKTVLQDNDEITILLPAGGG